MTLSRVLPVVAFCVAANAAPAAVYTYEYAGNELKLAVSDGGDPDTPSSLPGERIVMKIDEALLPGRTLKNANVAFEVVASDVGWDRSIDGLVSFESKYYHNLLEPLLDASLSFTTDGLRNIKDWRGYSADGGADWSSDPSGDSWLLSYEAPAGAWKLVGSSGDGDGGPTPIPVPATLPLLAAGLAALGLYRRKHVA